MRYAGPALGPNLNLLRCRPCGKNFQEQAGYAAHVVETHRDDPKQAVIVIDDVTTRGNTAKACRQVVMAATGAPRVFGLFVARTRGW